MTSHSVELATTEDNLWQQLLCSDWVWCDYACIAKTSVFWRKCESVQTYCEYCWHVCEAISDADTGVSGNSRRWFWRADYEV